MSESLSDALDGCASRIVRSVKDYKVEQLEDLLLDDAKIEKLIKAEPTVSSVKDDLQDKMRLCRWYADLNLSLQPQFEDVKSDLSSNFAALKKTEAVVHRLKNDLDSVADSRRLDVVAAVLRVAERRAEDESEAVADRFLNGALDVEEFIENFGERRSLFHTRRVKSEKLAALLRDQHY